MNDEILDDVFKKNESSNYRFVGGWDRFAAAFIDGIVLLPVTGLMAYNLIEWQSTGIFALTMLASFAYKPFLEWQQGATVGKNAMRFRVVDENFQPIELDHALIRYTPWMVNHILTAITFFYMMTSGLFGGELELSEYSGMIEASPVEGVDTIWNIVFLVIILPLIWDARHQGLHDKFAGTYNVYNQR